MNRAQLRVVCACYLGWTLDSFDFFLMVFVFPDVARSFGVSVTQVTFAVVLTLMMRAAGAWLFGMVAERFGRRPALMASILGYSMFGVASGLAPSFVWFLAFRALFGVAMGGEWGTGASLAMESVPARLRGRVSGLLQAGYPSGYLLASLAYGLLFAVVGWRGMFVIGAIPALLVVYIRSAVPESPAWIERQQEPREPPCRTLRQQARRAAYAIALMTCFNLFSHGTQDIYPLFLRTQRHLPVHAVSLVVIIYTIGAILGGIAFGTLSQRIGRRAAICAAAVLAMPMVLPWAFSLNPAALAAGAFLLQFCVQGAWGVIPAHLNELSPAGLRATFPGLTYQIGNFLAAINLPVQSRAAAALGGDYRWPLAVVTVVTACLIVVLVARGPEARSVRMSGGV